MFIKAWYGADTYDNFAAFPNQIFRVINSTTGGFPVVAIEAQQLYDSFIGKLSIFLDAQVHDLEPSIAWSETGPVNEPLLVYTNMVNPLQLAIPASEHRYSSGLR